MPIETPNDPVTLALAALAATLGDERRAQRFLDLTGIGTDELRSKAGDPSLLAALLRFLEAHEPDLLEIAEQLGVEPADLVEARRQLEDALSMKTILITGATAGFGEAAARKFVGGGWRAIGTGRRGDRLKALQEELGDAFLPLEIDMRDGDSLESLARLEAPWGEIDLAAQQCRPGAADGPAAGYRLGTGSKT